jgi:hypothetical protein
MLGVLRRELKVNPKTYPLPISVEPRVRQLQCWNPERDRVPRQHIQLEYRHVRARTSSSDPCGTSCLLGQRILSDHTMGEVRNMNDDADVDFSSCDLVT